MGGSHQETWKQPTTSLNAEWQVDNIVKSSQTLNEQETRMRETQPRLAKETATSGQIVPHWPEMEQPPNSISFQHASRGESSTVPEATTDGQASLPASSRIPHRYQTSSKITDAQPSHLLAKDAGGRIANSLPNSPLSSPKTHRRTRSEQLEIVNSAMESLERLEQAQDKALKIKSLGFPKTDQDHHDLPDDLDPSIISPHVFVVKLPDHVFQRTPPIAPRAMLEQLSHLNGPRQSRQGRRYSEATATSHRSYETAGSRARAYSSTTTNTHHSFEPVLPGCNDCIEPPESFGNEPTHAAPMASPGLTGENPPAALNTGTHQDINPPSSLGPPPGFESHQHLKSPQNIPPPPGFENAPADLDTSIGTWSYSKIWISDKERLRINFTRMQEKAHHVGLDKSPFLPQSVGEYAALLAEKKAAAAKRMRKKIQHSEKATQNRHHDEVEKETMFPVQNLGLFWGKKTVDGLSSVLAMESCFNSAPNAPEHERVDWPPNSEFRNWKASRPPPGTRWRSDSHRGPWPFPRVNLPFRPDETFDEGEIPYSKRKIVFSPRWDWAPRFVRSKDEEACLKTQEISMTWLFVANPVLADLVQEIQARPSQQK